MAKQRETGNQVRWTSPTGRTWTAPSQHSSPQQPCRPPAAVAPRHPDEPYDPYQGEDDPDLDPACDVLRADDQDPEDADAPDDIDERLADGWGLALTDPTRWQD